MLVRISPGYSPLTGRLHTCYSPVRRSPPSYCYSCAAPRLACVRPVASVHPEPGSNSSLYLFFNLLGCYLFLIYCRKLTWYKKNFPSLYYIICCSCILKDRCLKPLTPKGEFGYTLHSVSVISRLSNVIIKQLPAL